MANIQELGLQPDDRSLSSVQILAVFPSDHASDTATAVNAQVVYANPTLPGEIAGDFGSSIIAEAPKSPQTTFENIINRASEMSEAMVGRGALAVMPVVQVLQEEGIGLSDDMARVLSPAAFTVVLTLLLKYGNREKNLTPLRVLTTGLLFFVSTLAISSHDPAFQQLALSATAGNLAVEVGPTVIRGMGLIAQALIHRSR